MTRRSAISILLVTAMVSMLAACNLQFALPAGEVDRASTETLAALATQVAGTLQAVAPEPSDTPIPPASDTPTPPPTSIPPTQEAMARVNENTNCRTGPGTVYDHDFTALKGSALRIVGRSTVPDYVIVEIPGEPGHTCHLWTRYVDVSGDLSSLPVSTPPPTPTPGLQFTISYAYLEGCVGWDPGFKVVNTGGVTFRSQQTKAKDTVTLMTTQDSGDVFDKRNGCLVDTSIPMLDPGMTGYVYANTLVADPTGHALEVTVKLCTGPGLSGTCVSQSITATP
jgi:hypothetical protein